MIALINAVLPPVIAALRLPFTLVTGFLLVLFADAGALMLTDELFPEVLGIGSFGDALLASLVMAAVSIVLQALTGTNDEDVYSLQVIKRVARRQGGETRTDAPGIIFLEIDGLALPILRNAMRDGSAPNMARWISEGDYRLSEWETDLSSQTGASQAGILLGSNEDIPAFRWVEKETQTDDELLGARRLRRDRAPALDRDRPARRRRRQPRQPALRRRRRGHPHGQPDGGGEEGQPRLPGLPRQRFQRHPGAGCCSPGRWCSSTRPRSARSGATCARAATAAATTRSCAGRCA